MSSGGVTHGFTTETKSLMREGFTCLVSMIRRCTSHISGLQIHKICRIVTDLPIYHVTHRHSYPHACSLDVVVVEMLEDSQSKGGEGHCSSIPINHAKTSLVIWVIMLKELDYFPKKKWLNDFDGLLYGKDRQEKKYALDNEICQKPQIHPLLMLEMGTVLILFQAIAKKSFCLFSVKESAPTKKQFY